MILTVSLSCCLGNRLKIDRKERMSPTVRIREYPSELKARQKVIHSRSIEWSCICTFIGALMRKPCNKYYIYSCPNLSSKYVTVLWVGVAHHSLAPLYLLLSIFPFPAAEIYSITNRRGKYKQWK